MCSRMCGQRRVGKAASEHVATGEQANAAMQSFLTVSDSAAQGLQICEASSLTKCNAHARMLSGQGHMADLTMAVPTACGWR